MTLSKAIKCAIAGDFVTNQYFSSDQCMHYYKGNLYYEDGAVVTSEFLAEQEFAKDGWKVLAISDNIDKVKLKEMHEKSNGCMLSKGSYMDCICK